VSVLVTVSVAPCWCGIVPSRREHLIILLVIVFYCLFLPLRASDRSRLQAAVASLDDLNLDKKETEVEVSLTAASHRQDQETGEFLDQTSALCKSWAHPRLSGRPHVLHEEWNCVWGILLLLPLFPSQTEKTWCLNLSLTFLSNRNIPPTASVFEKLWREITGSVGSIQQIKTWIFVVNLRRSKLFVAWFILIKNKDYELRRAERV